MNEFNKCFNDFIHDLPDAIRPPNDVILIYYMGVFSDEIYYQCRDKEQSFLKEAQAQARKIESNMQDSGRSDLPDFTMGNFSKTNKLENKVVCTESNKPLLSPWRN